jgi:serine/threonine protein phosphatase PrpC
MSAGARQKQRPWASDPNEDAGAVLEGHGATALVVADAHFGYESSERAIDCVLEALGDDPPDASLSEAQLVKLFFDAGIAVQRETTRTDAPHPDSRTTLALALISSESVQWAAIGDSCIVVVREGEATRVDTPSTAFLGNRFTHADIAGTLTRGRLSRDDVDCVVCATDGLSDSFSRAGMPIADAVALHVAGARSAGQVADRLVSEALAQGVDDAVTVAVALC